MLNYPPQSYHGSVSVVVMAVPAPMWSQVSRTWTFRLLLVEFWQLWGFLMALRSRGSIGDDGQSHSYRDQRGILKDLLRAKYSFSSTRNHDWTMWKPFILRPFTLVRNTVPLEFRFLSMNFTSRPFVNDPKIIHHKLFVTEFRPNNAMWWDNMRGNNNKSDTNCCLPAAGSLLLAGIYEHDSEKFHQLDLISLAETYFHHSTEVQC